MEVDFSPAQVPAKDPTALVLGYMFASPLVCRSLGADFRPLDIAEEREAITQELKRSRNKINLFAVAATNKSIRRIVDTGITILHLTCHTVETDDGTPALVLENDEGGSNLLTASQLYHLVQAGTDVPTPPSSDHPNQQLPEHPIQLVFLSACNSASLGEVFVSAGVEHVVVVDDSVRVRDSVARTFAAEFYHYLLACDQPRTVKQAFDIALQRVATAPENRVPSTYFRLLPENKPHNKPIRTANHNSSNFSSPSTPTPLTPPFSLEGSPLGAFVDLTPPLAPTNLRHFKWHMFECDCRYLECQRVVSHLLNQQVVALVGEAGVGKTQVALAAATFLRERHRFPGGVFFVNAKHITQVENIQGVIQQAMREAGVATSTPQNDHFRLPPLPAGNKSCLFVLDGCESVLLREQSMFREYLVRWFDRVATADMIAICITCTQPLQSLAAQLYTVTHIVEKLRPLGRLDSARFIRLHCPRSMTWKDIRWEDSNIALIRREFARVLSQLNRGEPVRVRPEAIFQVNDTQAVVELSMDEATRVCDFINREDDIQSCLDAVILQPPPTTITTTTTIVTTHTPSTTTTTPTTQSQDYTKSAKYSPESPLKASPQHHQLLVTTVANQQQSTSLRRFSKESDYASDSPPSTPRSPTHQHTTHHTIHQQQPTLSVWVNLSLNNLKVIAMHPVVGALQGNAKSLYWFAKLLEEKALYEINESEAMRFVSNMAAAERRDSEPDQLDPNFGTPNPSNTLEWSPPGRSVIEPPALPHLSLSNMAPSQTPTSRSGASEWAHSVHESVLGERRVKTIGLRLRKAGTFRGRAAEVKQVLDCLAPTSNSRFVCVVGRPGMGKTSLIAHVCDILELDPTPQWDAIIFYTCRLDSKPMFGDIYHLAGRSLEGRKTEEFNLLWRDSHSTHRKISLLLEKTGSRRALLVLDQLECALKDREFASPEMKLLTELILESSSGLTVLCASCVKPEIATSHPMVVSTIELTSGLEINDAQSFLRSVDVTGALGLRDASAEILRELCDRCGGVPRALERVVGLMAQERTMTLDRLVSAVDEALDEKILMNLIDQHLKVVNDDQRHVLEVLSVFRSAVPFEALNFVVTYFYPAIDTAACLQELVDNFIVMYNRSTSLFELHSLDQHHLYQRLNRLAQATPSHTPNSFDYHQDYHYHHHHHPHALPPHPHLQYHNFDDWLLTPTNVAGNVLSTNSNGHGHDGSHERSGSLSLRRRPMSVAVNPSALRSALEGNSTELANEQNLDSQMTSLASLMPTSSSFISHQHLDPQTQVLHSRSGSLPPYALQALRTAQQHHENQQHQPQHHQRQHQLEHHQQSQQSQQADGARAATTAAPSREARNPISLASKYAVPSPVFTLAACHRRIADYYRSVQQAKHKWQSLVDVSNHISEFNHRCLAGSADDYKRAFIICLTLDYNHLSLWGHADVVVEMRSKLVQALKDGPLWMEINNIDWLGCACYSNGDFANAANVFRLGLDKVVRSATGDVILNDLEGNLGRALMAMGQLNAARVNIESCLFLQQRYKSLTGEALWLCKLGEHRRMIGDDAQAVAFFSKAVELSRKTQDEHYKVVFFSNLGDLLSELQHHKSGLEKLNHALRLAERNRNKIGEAHCRLRLGMAAHRVGSLGEALNNYKVAGKLNHVLLQHTCYLRMGIVFMSLGRHNDATDMFRESLAHCNQLLAKCSLNVDASYVKIAALLGLGRVDEAFVAMEIAQRLRVPQLVAALQENLRLMIQSGALSAANRREMKEMARQLHTICPLSRWEKLRLRFWLKVPVSTPKFQLVPKEVRAKQRSQALEEEERSRVLTQDLEDVLGSG